MKVEVETEKVGVLRALETIVRLAASTLNGSCGGEGAAVAERSLDDHSVNVADDIGLCNVSSSFDYGN
jgi:hypothetical protein